MLVAQACGFYTAFGLSIKAAAEGLFDLRTLCSPISTENAVEKELWRENADYKDSESDRQSSSAQVHLRSLHLRLPLLEHRAPLQPHDPVRGSSLLIRKFIRHQILLSLLSSFPDGCFFFLFFFFSRLLQQGQGAAVAKLTARKTFVWWANYCTLR